MFSCKLVFLVLAFGDSSCLLMAPIGELINYLMQSAKAVLLSYTLVPVHKLFDAI
jgi:hypothetical protein